MKKLLFFLSFLVLSSSLLAQNWVWAKAEVNDSATFSFSDALADATDNSGNIFITGAYLGTNTFGSFAISSSSPAYGVFLVKYNSTGNVLWAQTSFSSSAGFGNYFNAGMSVATDASGDAYVTGLMTDTLSFGAYPLYCGPSKETAFLTKYDANGNVLWAKNAILHSGSSGAWAYSVTVDGSGNAYITGTFRDTVTFGSYVLAQPGSNVFLAKYDANGNELWATCATNVNFWSITATSVTIDNLGNPYITGIYSGGSPSFGSCNLPNITSSDVYLVKFNPAGTALWATSATLLGGGVSAINLGGTYIAADKLGNIYLTGTYADSLKFGPYKLSTGYVSGDHPALFLVKYTSSGNVVWAKTSGSALTYNALGPYSIAVTPANDYVYTCGTFGDTLTFGNVNLISNTLEPSYLIKFDSSGKALCGTAINNENDDNSGVAIDPLGSNVYFVGDAYGDSCVFGSTKLTGTSEYSFLAKYTCGPCIINGSAGGAATICQSSSTPLFASGGTSYSWQPTTGLSSATIPNPVASPNVTTTYTVTISNGECETKDTVTVIVRPGPPVDVCCDSTIQPGQNVQLVASGGTSYMWTPSVGLNCTHCPNPIATPAQSTIYNVVITTDSGCSESRQVNIDITCGEVFVPNAFSPNHDGQNDVLHVHGDCINSMKFFVYDRWGNKVFESDNISDGWDGAYMGQPMNTGTYVYYLNAFMNDGSVVLKKGNVTLVR